MRLGYYKTVVAHPTVDEGSSYVFVESVICDTVHILTEWIPLISNSSSFPLPVLYLSWPWELSCSMWIMGWKLFSENEYSLRMKMAHNKIKYASHTTWHVFVCMQTFFIFWLRSTLTGTFSWKLYAYLIHNIMYIIQVFNVISKNKKI